MPGERAGFARRLGPLSRCEIHGGWPLRVCPVLAPVLHTFELGADSGGFTAIASNGDVDRDGERILPGCFAPLPDSVGVHLDHTFQAVTLVARARPYYVLDELRIDAKFSGTQDAQQVRENVMDGRSTP